MKTKICKWSVFIFLFVVFYSCDTDYKHQNITILFHGKVENNIDGYGALRYLKDSLRNETPYVSLVHYGNFADVSMLGNISRGENIVDIMNSVGYNVVSLGSMDFDFGTDQLNKLVNKLKAKVVSCNYSTVKNNKMVYRGYFMCEYGDTKIAFLGIVNPKVLQIQPAYSFLAKNTEKAYNFNENDISGLVQRTVNHARLRGADFVILLTDLDIDANEKMNCHQLVSNTYGIDAVLAYNTLDTVLVQEITDKKNKKIILASSDFNLKHIGALIINEEKKFEIDFIETKKIPYAPKTNNKMVSITKATNIRMDEYVGYNQFDFINTEKDNYNKDTLIYDFIASAIREMTRSDISVICPNNFSPVLDTGIIRYKDLYNLCPTRFSFARMDIKGKDLMQNFIHTLADTNTIKEEKTISLCVNGIKIDSATIKIFHKNTWQPVDTNKKYTITTYSDAFVLGQMLFSNFKTVRNINKDNTTILINYISGLNDSITPERFSKIPPSTFINLYHQHTSILR